MATFGSIAQDLRKIDINSILDRIFSQQNIQSWIIETIQARLYNTGTTGSQTKLKTDKAFGSEFYSKATLDIKSYFNKRIENVTLKDSGDFYASMRIVLIQNGFATDAKFQKSDGQIFKNFTQQYSTAKEFNADVMSLTDAELENLIQTKIIPELLTPINEII